MKKVFAITLLFVLIGITLYGCGSIGSDAPSVKPQTEASDFVEWEKGSDAKDLNEDEVISVEDFVLWKEFNAWKSSEEAFDYDGDRKITYSDYAYLISYDEWKRSSSAMDLNGDRRITQEDYDLYLNPQKTNYIKWAYSPNAVDLNDDNVVDEDDYVLVSSYVDFIGKFHIINFEIKSEYSPCFVDSDFSLNEMKEYLPDIVFSIDKFGKTSWTYPEELKNALGTDWTTANGAVENAVMEKLSERLSRIYITIPSEDVELSIHLIEKMGVDYSTSFSYSFNTRNGSGTVEVEFDILYE